MGMNLNLNRQNQTRNNARSGQQDDDFVRAEFWANVGYWEEIDGEPVFVSLTKGIPLDQLKSAPGSSELSKLKNRLNRICLEAAQSFEPGQAEDVIELTVQIRRAADQNQEPDADKPSKLVRLTFGSKG